MKIFLLATVLSQALWAFAQPNNSISLKKDSILIDGDQQDWKGYTFYSDEKSRTTYSITNDSQKIYFLFKFSDVITQMKVLRAGLEIKMDTLGRTSYPISIIFPFSTDRYNNDVFNYSVTGIKPNMDFEKNKNKMICNSNRIRLIGFKNGYGDIMINKNNSLNVETGLKFNNENELIYELSVPIKLFFEGNLKNYKHPFLFNFNILGFPIDATSVSDSKYFEDNNINIKAKLATP